MHENGIESIFCTTDEQKFYYLIPSTIDKGEII